MLILFNNAIDTHPKDLPRKFVQESSKTDQESLKNEINALVLPLTLPHPATKETYYKELSKNPIRNLKKTKKLC